MIVAKDLWYCCSDCGANICNDSQIARSVYPQDGVKPVWECECFPKKYYIRSDILPFRQNSIPIAEIEIISNFIDNNKK